MIQNFVAMCIAITVAMVFWIFASVITVVFFQEYYLLVTILQCVLTWLVATKVYDALKKRRRK